MSKGIVRRQDKVLGQAEMDDLLDKSLAGHFATADLEGNPYIVPNLFIYQPGKIYCHNTSATGHFLSNILANPRVCFEVVEAGEIYPYGSFECDTSISYRSVVCFGKMKILEEREEKQRFFDMFMAKYSSPQWDRPKSFYPRLELVTVYCLQIDRMTGKGAPLPSLSAQWPTVNNTRTPRAVPPSKLE